MYDSRYLVLVLNIIEPLWQDGDRFKQRASAEILQGMLRGQEYLSLSEILYFILCSFRFETLGSKSIRKALGLGCTASSAYLDFNYAWYNANMGINLFNAVAVLGSTSEPTLTRLHQLPTVGVFWRVSVFQYVICIFYRLITHGCISSVVSKSLSLVGIMAECLGVRFEPYADRYLDLFFNNANTGYAEVRIFSRRIYFCWITYVPIL